LLEARVTWSGTLVVHMYIVHADMTLTRSKVKSLGDDRPPLSGPFYLFTARFWRF